MSDPQKEMRQWMKDELKALGHGAKSKLANYLGVGADTITRMANLDPDKETKIIPAHHHLQMVEFFERHRQAKKVSRGLRPVVVAAFVQAGHWAETWEWPEDEQYKVFVEDVPDFRSFKLRAAETRGPSMNKRWPEKTVIVFTDLEETGEQPIAGKRYIVERRRLGGEAEHTVKLLHVDAEGKYWLMPESDDPRFQAPISVDDGTGDGDVVSIIGRVHFAVSRE